MRLLSSKGLNELFCPTLGLFLYWREDKLAARGGGMSTDMEPATRSSLFVRIWYQTSLERFRDWKDKGAKGNAENRDKMLNLWYIYLFMPCFGLNFVYWIFPSVCDVKGTGSWIQAGSEKGIKNGFFKIFFCCYIKIEVQK